MMAVELQIHGHFFSTLSKRSFLIKNCVTLPTVHKTIHYFPTHSTDLTTHGQR